MYNQKHRFLGEILLKTGIIYENQLLSALNEQKRSPMRFGEILLKNGWISEMELAEGLSEQLRVPLVQLSEFKPHRKALEIVPQSMALKLKIIPIELNEGKSLKVVTSDPMDLLTKDELHFFTGLDIEFVISTLSDIQFHIRPFYDSLKETVTADDVATKSALIGGILLNAGLISEKQIESALKEQKYTHMRFGEILLKNGWLSERQLAEGLGTQLGITVYSFKDFVPQKTALGKIPENVAIRLQALPLKVQQNGSLLVAVAEPMDVLAIDELRNIAHMEIEVWIAIPSELRREIPTMYNELYNSSSDLDRCYKKTLLGQVLLNADMITEQQLDNVLELQRSSHQRMGDILLQEGYLNERELADGLSQQMKIPTVLLSDFKPQPELLSMVPVAFAEKHQVLPLEEAEDGSIICAIAEPLSLDTVDELSQLTCRETVFRIARPSSLKKEIPLFYAKTRESQEVS